MKKRWLLFLIIAGLLLIHFVSAQNFSNTTAGISGIGDKTNEVLGMDMGVTPELQWVARLLFGIKEKISLDYFIVLICIFIGFVILLQRILLFIPIFSEWKSWVGSIIITWLIGISRTFFWIIDFLFSFANVFGILERWTILRVIVVVLLIIVFIVGFVIVAKYLEKKKGLYEAEDSGFDAGVGARMMKTVADSTRKQK